MDAWLRTPFDGQEALDDLIARIACALASRALPIATAAQPVTVCDLPEPQ